MLHGLQGDGAGGEFSEGVGSPGGRAWGAENFHKKCGKCSASFMNFSLLSFERTLDGNNDHHR